MCRRPNLTVVHADGYFVKNNLRNEKLACYKIPIGINKNLHIHDKSLKLNESHYNQQLQEIKSPRMIDAKNADYQNITNDQLTLLH